MLQIAGKHYCRCTVSKKTWYQTFCNNFINCKRI